MKGESPPTGKPIGGFDCGLRRSQLRCGRSLDKKNLVGSANHVAVRHTHEPKVHGGDVFTREWEGQLWAERLEKVNSHGSRWIVRTGVDKLDVQRAWEA